MADELVLVPGMLGSALSTGGGELSRPTTVWYNPGHFAVYGPDWLDLGANGIDPGPLAQGKILRPSGWPDTGIIEPWVTQATNDGWRARVWVYDWRKSLRINAALFAQFLSKEYTTPFWICGHSMGGLIARLAYPIWRTLVTDSTQWQRTVYVGVPHGGSYNAAAFLAGGMPEPGLLRLFLICAGQTFRRWVLGGQPSSTLADRVNQVLASWPALYELLPSSVGAYLPIDKLTPQLLQSWSYTPTNRHVTQARLNDAAQTIAALWATRSQPLPPETQVVGIGLATQSLVKDATSLFDDDGYNLLYDADGVVPANRARLPDLPTLSMVMSHGLFPTRREFLERMTALLHGTISLPYSVPAPPPTLPPVVAAPLPGRPYVFPFPSLVRRGDP